MRWLVAAALVLLFSGSVHAEEKLREQLWREVQEAVNKGLPKTAIEKLEPIIQGALADKKHAEAVKAIGKRIALEGQIEGNKPEEKVTRMQAEIAKAPAEMRPIMEAILANWYWQYFQQNRWRFLQRTQTAAPPGDDFTTWDLSRLIAEIDKQFQQALAASEQLKQIEISEYDDLLEKGTAPDSYRPTLYDFAAHNALEFYSAGEQAAARAEDAFDLGADSPVFSSVEEFLAWKPTSTDERSVTLKAILLYQDLLRFHAGDDDPSARLHCDLSRLEFGNNQAFGEEKTARFKAALKRFAEAHARHELSAWALHAWALAVHGEGDWVEARKLAQEGLARHPGSVGGNRCYNLIQQIEARECQVSCERVWNRPWPGIDVAYRNVRKIYFRVVTLDFEAQARAPQYRQPDYLDQNQRQAMLAQAAVLQWDADLPATEDFQQRVETLAAPEDLKPGSYYLISSHNPQFNATDNQISFTEFWVSELAMVMRPQQGSEVLEGLVLNAATGEPLEGATVRAWHTPARSRDRVAERPVKTNRDGLFRLPGSQRHTILVHAAHEGQALSSTHNYSVYGGQAGSQATQRTVFFTDRALYRPGQTIQFKGICLSTDPDRSDYRALPGTDVQVLFSDVNGKEIERLKLRTNDYGSFSGSVTAPRDRLAGRMTLRVDGGPNGATQVQVEEYKRPKFQVEVAPPAEAPRLGGPVKVAGKATAYTGAAINGAKVRWRVVREVRYPIWWMWRCWWMPPQSGGSQEIAHGSAQTAANGSFEVEFTARPDASVPEESEPTFQFTVYADVTDTTGETRSANRSLRVGYTALAATLTADEWQEARTPAELTVRTTTLDGEGQAAEGVLKVYRLRQPRTVQRPSLAPSQYRSFRGRIDMAKAPAPDPANPTSWPLGEMVLEEKVATDALGVAKVSAKLDEGVYRVKLEANDRFGKPVTAELPLQVLNPEADKLGLKIPFLLAAPKWSLEPGGEFKAVWGSGYDQARAYVELARQGKPLQSFWTAPGATQLTFKQAVDESMRGGLTLRVTMVRENRAYLETRMVDVPWTNKQLTIKWEHFVSKLQPAQKETWTAVVSGADAKFAVAEMVAAMYDASLDAYLPHSWTGGFVNMFRREHSTVQSSFENRLKGLQGIVHAWQVDSKPAHVTYRRIPGDILGALSTRYTLARGRGGAMQMDAASFGAPMAAQSLRKSANRSDGVEEQAAKQAGDAAGGPDDAAGPDLSKVAARKNLNETAFFFPHLLADAEGQVRLEFTMPEALTEWKFLGFAHDAALRGGILTDKVVTSKDLMVEPNPPRFVREGDQLEFTVKVSNQSAGRQAGKVRLSFADAVTAKSVDNKLANTVADQDFDIAAGESKSFSWKLSVPDDLGFVTFKAVGATGRLSDGEEGFLPVLSRRVLVTESLPLPIRGPATQQFEFARLLKSGDSDSLQHKTLTMQMVSNPSWYAVLALPYLMEFPHECSEQTFNRLYANALARHIARSDPKIRRVFDVWKNAGGDTLDSPLEKNEDLKAVLIEETPWLRNAANESQARRQIGILFDDNRLDEETGRLLRKLSEMQSADGRWPWFPGGRENDYITLYITTGFGRMRHLGVDIDVSPAIKAVQRLDAWVTEIHDRIPAADRDKNHLSTHIALYLYGRSFFLQDQPVAQPHQAAFNYWVAQARKNWLPLGVRQSQAHVAVALKRIGDLETPKAIMASIKEHSLNDGELGMYWRDLERSWWWYRAPIETQAMMIEAFDEVMNDRQAVEDCKVWLLKQKQTQDWKTSKATADAVYGLLLRGTNLLASDALVEVSLAGQKVQPEKVEAGTGFFEQRLTGGEIRPELGKVTVKKVDEGVAWGSLHWQYLEDMSKVTAYSGAPLKLTKQLYVKKNSKQGPVLELVEGPIEVGDELVVRLVLRTDRDMEYVHLKDYRGSGAEPVNVLSRYKFQDGLYYYESTKDTASHFFIDYLPKGVYVFEYSVRVQLRGQYQTGFAAIQCMYAPEFNGHSESLMMEVK